jgi:hypothetical protein
MVTIRMKATGKVLQVERNKAHALIDSGQAELVASTPPKREQTYNTRQVKSRFTK